MKDKKIKTSEKISKFLKLIEDSKKLYKFNLEIVENCNKRTTDYLHSLELDNLNYPQRCKLSTEQRKNLKERRKAKDIVEELEPIIVWVGQEDCVKGAMNQLKQALGGVRKIENYHQNRSYRKRIGG